MRKENAIFYESKKSTEHFYRMGEDIIRDRYTGNISKLSEQFLFTKGIRERGLDSFSMGKMREIKRFFESFKVNYIEEYNEEIIPIQDAHGFTLGKVINFICHNETI